MTLLLDEHHARLAPFFRDRGHSVYLVTGELSAGEEDPAIVAWAEKYEAVVVTSDGGFKRRVTRVPNRDGSRLKRAGLLVLHGDHSVARDRLTQVIDLIEFVYGKVQTERDRRLVMEIRAQTIYLER